MTNTTLTSQQLDTMTNYSNDNEACTKFTPSRTPIKTATVPQVARLQNCRASETARKCTIPFGIQRYLEEVPNAGGAIYDLNHGSRPRDIHNILAIVDMEFGERKTPN